MRRHKAWRGGSNSAAKLRSRHRAKNESDKVSKSGDPGGVRERSGGRFFEVSGGFLKVLGCLWRF